MLSQIKISNFKSHKYTTLEIGNLTVFCGINGVGKSSAIQILLLLREAFLKNKSFEYLDLKSNPVKIGSVDDAIYQFSEEDGFQFHLTLHSKEFIFKYEAKTENLKTKSYIQGNVNNVSFNFKEVSLFNTNFQYISAARKGPQEKYEKDDIIVGIHKQISVIEGMAEYFVHFLETYRDLDVLESLCLPAQNEKVFSDLYTQVALWENYIFGGVNMEVKDIGNLGYLLKYSYENQLSVSKKTKDFDAKNVGFGLTYTLPILVAILAAQKEAIIIIENPEAHLHPSGISRLTELICRAAQAGIQIILETHSDHVINGILVQCKKFEELNIGIDRNQVSIYQFDRNEKEHCAIETKILIEEGGRIRNAPHGFFDQIQNDLEQILGF